MFPYPIGLARGLPLHWKSVLTQLYVACFGKNLIIIKKRRPHAYSRSGLALPYNPYVEACAQWRILQWIVKCSSFSLSRC